MRTWNGAYGLGALTDGQRSQARLQFMQRVEAFTSYPRELISDTTADAGTFNALATRIEAHVNSLRYFTDARGLNNWGVVGEGIIADVAGWLRAHPLPSSGSPPAPIVVTDEGEVITGADQGGDLFVVTGRNVAPDKPAWGYWVLGAGVLGLGALLSWNAWRRM